MTLPRISIVTPSYNQGRFVAKTVRSVLGQRYPNIEYIFMDGGSTDETLEAIKPYQAQFSYFQSEPDGGQSAAIHKGLTIATGDILAYLNSDDVLLPGALNVVCQFFDERPDVDMVYSNRCMINEHGIVTGYWILPPHCNFLMKRWDLIPQENCFWRRSLMERAGSIDPTFQFAMDYDLFVRFMDKGRLKRIKRMLGAFRVHKSSKSSTLLTTTGKEEISRVYTQYNIRPVRYVGRLYREYVQLCSQSAAKATRIPRHFSPRVGRTIDDVWGW